jgi:hypothetical protein
MSLVEGKGDAVIPEGATLEDKNTIKSSKFKDFSDPAKNMNDVKAVKPISKVSRGKIIRVEAADGERRVQVLQTIRRTSDTREMRVRLHLGEGKAVDKNVALTVPDRDVIIKMVGSEAKADEWLQAYVEKELVKVHRKFSGDGESMSIASIEVK